MLEFRHRYPTWGRRRIGHLLRHPVREDSCPTDISDATVGRILARLVATGRAQPVSCFTATARKRRQRRTRRVTRLRGALKADRPGDAVQIDTLSIWFPGNRTVKQFTAVDRGLDDFNHHYNRQRPHQALGGLTPWQYLQSTAA